MSQYSRSLSIAPNCSESTVDFQFSSVCLFFLLWFSFSVLFVLFYLSRASERYSLCVVDKLKVSIGFQHMKYNHGNEIYLFDVFFLVYSLINRLMHLEFVIECTWFGVRFICCCCYYCFELASVM